MGEQCYEASERGCSGSLIFRGNASTTVNQGSIVILKMSVGHLASRLFSVDSLLFVLFALAFA